MLDASLRFQHGSSILNCSEFRLIRRVTVFATASLILGAAFISAPAQASPKREAPVVQAIEHSSEHPVERATAAPSAAAYKGQRVCATILIKAPPAEVWRTIHEERASDPDLCYSKVLEQINPNECKLEQKFNFIPVIGSSVCVMSNREVPNERIDYALLKSDRFKAMEGSWVLTSCEEGKATKLELSSRLDLGLPVPRSMMNSVTGKKIQKRLANVKRMAEANATKVAAKQEHHPN